MRNKSKHILKDRLMNLPCLYHSINTWSRGDFMSFLMVVHQLWAPHNLGVQNKVYYKMKQRF